MSQVDQTEKPDAMSAEQGADFAAIQAAAAGADVAAPAPGQEVAAQQGPSSQALGVAAMAMASLQPLLCHAVRGLDTAPQELWPPVTEGLAAVLEHLGITRPEMLGPWGKLGFSLLPLTGFVIIARMSEPPPEKKEGQQAIAAPDLTAAPPPAAQGSKVVTFGAPA